RADLSCAKYNDLHSTASVVSELDAEHAQLAIEVSSLYPRPLGDFGDVSAQCIELILEVRALEFHARRTQRNIEADRESGLAGTSGERVLDFGFVYFLARAENQQTLHEIL